jgi:glycosyltransferase involved in cell wall biosynthesis
MKSLSILIPIYNEEESLQALFEELKSSFENNQSIEIIFINDGSSDMSQKVIENEIANQSTWKLINLYRNYGKSVALQSGIDIVSNELIATLDGDLQDDPKELINLVCELNEDDVIVGWKKDRLDPFEKKIASKYSIFL